MAVQTAKKTVEREVTILDLYQRIFPSVANYVAKMGGTFDEAKDVFHDALLVYYEKTISQSVDIRRNEKGYVFGIARYVWIKRYRENRLHTSLDRLVAEFDGRGVDLDWEDDPQCEVASNRILRVLQTAGEKCMQLLMGFYYEKLDMEELASRFGFSGTRSATVQKFKCLQKVKQVVKEKSLQYEDFVG